MGPNPDPQEPTPVVGYVCTVNLEDLDASVEKAVALGWHCSLRACKVVGC